MSDDLSMWDNYDPDDVVDEEAYQRLIRSPEGRAIILSTIEVAEAEREEREAEAKLAETVVNAWRGGFTPEEIAKEIGQPVEQVNFWIRNRPARRPKKKG